MPPESRPLDPLLPRGGILQHPQWGYLRIPERNIRYVHEIDFQSREVRIHAIYQNTLSRDSATLWTAYYQELATYTLDMYDIGFRRLWLNSLIGQKGGHVAGAGGSQFDIAIPVNMPAWMKDFGFDRPKLLLQGQMDIRLVGKGEIDDAPGSTRRSLWPSPTLEYNPSFVVKGKIGRHITVEVNNTQGGLGVRNQLRVVYAEETPGEFEDFILQRVEVGSTSLSLSGTELTGYSEKHQGLFGIRTDLKVGDVRLTAIASQEGGSQEKHTLRSAEEESEFQILDKQFTAYRYYFHDHNRRRTYIARRVSGGSPFMSNPGLTLYKRSPINNQAGVLSNITAVYTDPSGNLHERRGLRLVPMREGVEWSWHKETGTIRLSGITRNSMVAASWSGDGLRGGSSSVQNGQQVVLIKDDNAASFPDIEQLMLRNVYAVGLSESNRNSFILTMKDRNRRAGDFLKTLGVVDTTTGSPLVGNKDVFLLGDDGRPTGEMMLPCHPLSWYQQRGVPNAQEMAERNCLEPLRNLDSSQTINEIYELPVHNLNRVQSLYFFESVGKRRKTSISVRDVSGSYSVSGGGCFDIAPGTERLKIGATVLESGKDYQVSYELGQIELISDRALDPNNEIEVTYECEPLFELESKVLLGLRAELPLRRFGTGSLLGATFLFKNQTTTQRSPRFGGEPFSSLLWGANMRLTDSSVAMDKITNAIPFINTQAKSRWTVETEVAQSRHNPNTSGKRSALLDDFESSARTLQFPLYRSSWFHASPPGGVSEDPSTFIGELSYRRLGEFIWHSNQFERYRNIYREVGDVDVDSRQMPILKLNLRPNDALEGKSWGGVMRANPQFFQDLSTMRYIEIVARGQVGNVFVDLGAISEDIAINNFPPNGALESEAEPGTNLPLNDKGLDGLTGAEERRVVWDCRVPGCDSTVVIGEGANTDPARDNFNQQRGDSDPSIHINGAEGNAGERPFDTEDLDRNGSLETEIRLVRYRLDLANTPSETLRNGWRRFRIPLESFDTIVSPGGGDFRQILANARLTRLWYGRLPSGVAQAQVQIVEFRIVGNQWEEDGSSDAYAITNNPVNQTVEVDGGRLIDVLAPGTVVVSDNNFLRVRTINNRENFNDYFKSPNTLTERDRETNAALREQSLSLEFGSLHGGQEVGATRYFDGETRDLTAYKNIAMEIHFQSMRSQVPVRFAIRVGHGGLDGSQDYYEWSFRPRLLRCESQERLQQCHDRNWLSNSFDIPLSDWTALKAGRMPPFLEDVERARFGDSASARDERVRLVGNPSLSRVNWVRFVIIADEGASTADLEGTFWINDLRLSGVSTEVGSAVRLRSQLDFADVMNISGEMRFQDGHFATLRSEGRTPLPSLAEMQSQMDLNGNYALMIHKFFPDAWGLRMPFNLGYSSTIRRPYLKPSSDQPLTRDDLGDMGVDFVRNDLQVDSPGEEFQLRQGEVPQSKGYQTISRTRTVSIGMSKEYKQDDNLWQEITTQMLLERPSINYRFRETEARSALRTDSNYTYNTVIDYKLGTFNRFNYRPFVFMQDRKWAPRGLSQISFEPWPQTFDLSLFDLTYAKTLSQERDPDFVDAQVPRVLRYAVDLNHAANIRWNIFPFLTASYTLGINRDMQKGGDQPEFTKERFFSPDGGMFASGVVWDFDATDRKLYTSLDSVYRYEVGRRPRTNASGDTIPMIPGDTTTYIPIYDSTSFYRIDSVGNRSYGRAYGILRNERNRQQNFRLTFNPEFIPFLPTRFAFASTLRQSKTIPEEFEFFNYEHARKNFWSIDHTNRFEASPTLRLLDLLALGGRDNAVRKWFDKLRWRDVRANWSVDLKTTGEDFTLAQLFHEQGVTPFQYYLYGLGLGDGYRGRTFWNLVTGDMNLTRPSHFEDFADYRNRNVDTMVYQGRFLHGVTRKASGETGLTLPWWDVGLTGSLGWEQDFRQQRENPLFLDTTLTWPRVGVGLNFPNFAQRIAWTKTRLRSLTANHRTEYTEVQTVRPFQSAEDEWRYTWALSPLLRVAALTPKGVRIDNSMNFRREYVVRRPKVQVIRDVHWPGLGNLTEADTVSQWFSEPWIHTAIYEDWSYTFGNEFGLGYDIKAKRGFQFWKWYVRLENDINVRLASGYDYRLTIREFRGIYPGYDPLVSNAAAGEPSHGIQANSAGGRCPVNSPDPNCWTVYSALLVERERYVPIRQYSFFVRPEASYQFNRMAQANAFIEYRRIVQELDEGRKHTRQILRFEIALMLRFN